MKKETRIKMITDLIYNKFHSAEKNDFIGHMEQRDLIRLAWDLGLHSLANELQQDYNSETNSDWDLSKDIAGVESAFYKCE